MTKSSDDKTKKSSDDKTKSVSKTTPKKNGKKGKIPASKKTPEKGMLYYVLVIQQHQPLYGDYPTHLSSLIVAESFLVQN